MKYRVEFLGSAEREFLRLPKTDRQRVAKHIDALADNPRPQGCVKLSGQRNLWRIRAGNYRILYAIDDVPMIVSITRIGHRLDVYRDL